MTEHFLNYEQSLAVKELGFDEKCLAYYKYDKELYQEEGVCYTNGDFGETIVWDEILPNKNCTAPLKSQFFKWVRDKYGLYSHIFSKGDGAFVWCIRWYEDGEQKDIPYELVYTYEQAEDACINKIIELLKLK